MSWSITAPSQTAATIEEAAREQFAAMDGQFEAALHAAQSVLASGAVGSTPVIVALSGHANPGHVKREGWANDTVTISISQH